MDEPARDATRLLTEWRAGNDAALDRLIPLVYDELRELARRYLRRERREHTLQPTALVHEAYLRLVDQQQAGWRNRAHFIAIAAQMMRRILVDHARAHDAAKRGSGAEKLSIDSVSEPAVDPEVDVIALDAALERLAALDPVQARIVELRFFGGLTIEETSEVVGVGPTTVKREWQMARAWLFRELGKAS